MPGVAVDFGDALGVGDWVGVGVGDSVGEGVTVGKKDGNGISTLVTTTAPMIKRITRSGII